MRTSCYDSQDSLKIPSSRVQLLAEAFLRFKEIETDEVIFHFVDKKVISALHDKYFNDPKPTDCISFPIDNVNDPSGGHHILGEVFVCPEVAIEYALKNQLNPYHELSLYITHGLLHLLGYDDLSFDKEKVMRQEEKRCMDYLRNQNVLIDEPSQT